MKYFALTEKGKREHNEDAVFVPMHSEVALAVVADGMGGHNAGDTASAMALDIMVSEVKRGGASPIKLLERAVEAANKAVYSASRANFECRGMGTTAVLAMPFISHFVAANIGDSRIYHYHDETITQSGPFLCSGAGGCGVYHPRSGGCTSQKKHYNPSHRHICQREAGCI